MSWELLDRVSTIFGLTVGLIGFSIAITQYLYYNKIGFFIWVNKRISWNKDVNFEVSLSAMNSVDNLNLVLKKSRKILDYESKLLSSSKNKIIFTVDTMIVEIRNDHNLDPDSNSEYEFEFLVKNANSTYPVATKNLRILDNLFSELVPEFNLKEPVYSFKSVFPKKNPFIGTAVSKIGFDKIKRFYMILSAEVLDHNLNVDEHIQVNLNEISFVENRFSKVREVANIILAI